MRPRRLLTFATFLLVACCAAALPARAAVLYSGLQDLSIPTDFAGVYLDIDTGAHGTVEFTGWDVNPFFGGVGVANSPAFQPVRSGTGNTATILRLNVGDSIGTTAATGRQYSSGYGGSDSHLGAGPSQFGIGQQGYLGFKFTPNGGGPANYGWMRVLFTADTAGALIKDWAYETSGSTIVAGRVQQSAPVAGLQTLTLSPGAGESFTYGSAIANPGGGTLTALLKSGAGATTLTTAATHSGPTTVSGGTLELATGGTLSATASLTVNTGGTLLLSGPGGTNTHLNPTASATLAGGKIDLSGQTSSLNQSLGVLTLSANSTLDFGTLAGGNTLRFADSSAATWAAGQTLSIWNWTGGADHLYFGTNNLGLSPTQLGTVRFYSDSGATLIPGAGFGAGDGVHGELTPVPEPGSLPLATALLALIAYRERRPRPRR